MGMRPVRYARITNPFAAKGSYASRRDSHGPAGHHTGIDFGDQLLPLFKAIDNLPVRSSLPGVVCISEYNSTMGHWVGVYTPSLDLTITYWHMTGRRVAEGEWVQQGDVLGHVGTTGNSKGVHLHVQANYGEGFDYHGHIDPAPWCLGMLTWWPGVILARRRALRARRKRQRVTLKPMEQG